MTIKTSLSTMTREELEEEVLDLRDKLTKATRIATDRRYSIDALVNMLGPKALQVYNSWVKKGLIRVHYSWTKSALSDLTGEERAQIILDFENAPRQLVDNIDTC